MSGPNLANLVNRRPKRNPHLIEGVQFTPRTNRGVLLCTCGERLEGEVADLFSAHRKEAGEPGAKSSLTVPDMLRGQPSVWHRSNGELSHREKTHCKRGHALAGDNLSVRPQSKHGGLRRECRACARLRMAASRAAAA